MIKNVINILLAVVFLIAVVYLIIGGFRYIMSQGNEESVEKAKGTITNAIIGIVVVLLAWIIVAAVTSLLNTGATQS
jgi:TRAP-type C4-dicarboxylate transport system permease small subunit